MSVILHIQYLTQTSKFPIFAIKYMNSAMRPNAYSRPNCLGGEGATSECHCAGFHVLQIPSMDLTLGNCQQRNADAARMGEMTIQRGDLLLHEACCTLLVQYTVVLYCQFFCLLLVLTCQLCCKAFQ